MTDQKCATPLHGAWYFGNETTVNYLKLWGMDINKQDNLGMTPLHLALILGNSRIVRRL